MYVHMKYIYVAMCHNAKVFGDPFLLSGFQNNQVFVKGGVYLSNRTLKQRVWGEATGCFISQSAKMMPIIKSASYIATISSKTNRRYVNNLIEGVVGGDHHKIQIVLCASAKTALDNEINA